MTRFALPIRGVFALVMLGMFLSCAPTIPKFEFTYAEMRKKLDNGLRMVIIPDKNTNMVQVDVRYEVGSNENPPGRAGLAHLVEHMMFQHRLWGDDKPPLFQVLPQIAVGLNAYTTWDKTHYYLSARSEDLESLLRVEAARMAAGCKGIPEAEFEREREVVRNEIRGRRGTPEGVIPQILTSAAYPKGHAYEQMVGGDDEQISSITFRDVCDFMAKYYQPGSATVVVTGNVEPEKAGQMIEFAFGAIPGKKPAPRKPVEPIELKKKRIEVEVDIDRPMVFVMWKLPAQYSEEWTAAAMLINVMRAWIGSFAEDWELASSVRPGLIGGALAPVYYLQIELYDYDKVGEVLDFVWKAARRTHQAFEPGVFETETRNLAKGEFVMSLESLAARAARIADLVQFRKDFNFESDGIYMIEELNRYDELDPGKYRSFVKRTLDRDKAVVVVVKPKKEGKKGDKRSALKFETDTGGHARPVAVVDPKEAKQPIKAPQTDSALTGAQRFTLGNGMDVVLLPFSAMPVVTAQLMFRAGTVHEPPEKAGLADVAARFLRAPLGGNVFSKIGAWFYGRANADTTVFQVQGLEIHLDVLLKGLERRIKIGDYSQTGIERHRKSVKDSKVKRQVRERDTLSRELSRAVYGEDHPYALHEVTPDTIAKVGRDAAHAFRNKHYTAKNATLIVTGKFDPKKAEEIIRYEFGSWSGGRKDEPATQPAILRGKPTYVGIVTEDEKPQMDIRLGYVAPPGIDGQQAARMVLSEMLRETVFRIRTELGSAYTPFMIHAQRVGPGFYLGVVNVDARRAGESLAATRRFIDELRAGGERFDIEFVRARRVIMRRLLGESTLSEALADRLANIATYDLKPEYYDRLVRMVAAVSPAQVKALLESELRPQNEVIVTMGDRPTLEKAFAEAGLDDVKYVEVK